MQKNCWLTFAVLLLLLFVGGINAADHDVIVVGGTPGGIAAALTAARLGHHVALVEYHAHLGGMSASGLGKTDIETHDAIGGLFSEFVERIAKHYRDKYGPDSEQFRLCRNGYYYEPSVAESVFDQMVKEQSKIEVYRGHRLTKVTRAGQRVSAIDVVDRKFDRSFTLRGKAFIDGTYEGDLSAYAGVRCRLGREGRSEFNELHAGVVYQDYTTRAFLKGTTGEGDNRLQAYTYRLCLSTDPANSVPLTEPPPDYDRSRYLGYLDDWKAGRLGPPVKTPKMEGRNPSTVGTVVRAFSIAAIPNGKTDVNMNPRPLAFPFVEENIGYPEADWPTREKISARIRNITLGLLYFLQNDPDVPAEHRQLANRFHLAKDEFTDNGHFPWQLYVREARRIIGLYTLSEQDVIVGPELGRTRVHEDSIAAGEFPIDSFPVRKREPGHDKALEGYLLMEAELTKPYQIPYRVLVPAEIDGLLAPVPASTTHVAFSTIRLEPTWMALGQAAGTAAHLAIQNDCELRAVDTDQLQRMLLKQGQVITYFQDIDRHDAAYEAVQFFGARGFFLGYKADAAAPVDRATVVAWLTRLPRQPEGWSQFQRESPTPISREELRRLFPDGLLPAGESPVARGELCQALYRWLEKD